MAIAGDTSLTTELRVRTCIEMVTNKDSYLKKHKNSGIKFVSPDYSEAVKDCSREGKYSSAWTIDAAATVLQRKISSVYPPVNGLLDKTVSILNTTFMPNLDNCTQTPPIFLMWTNVSPPRPGTTWIPNHFVPLLIKRPPQVINITADKEENIEEV